MSQLMCMFLENLLINNYKKIKQPICLSTDALINELLHRYSGTAIWE